MSDQMKHVPYFSQWESADLTAKIIDQGVDTALRQDPLWRSSGASSIDEYAAWAWNICGMACLKMMLAARTGIIWPTIELARRCAAYGGYVVEPETPLIKGLIYAPFVEFVGKEFGFEAKILTGVAAEALPEQLKTAEFFLASVHSSIRSPHSHPPKKGGHLVLVIAVSDTTVLFHNPSGFERETQINVAMDLGMFGRYFAGRGIAII